MVSSSQRVRIVDVTADSPSVNSWKRRCQLLIGSFVFGAFAMEAPALLRSQQASSSQFVDENARFSFDLPCPYTTQRHTYSDGGVTYEIDLGCNHVQVLLSLTSPSGDDEALLRDVLKSTQQDMLTHLNQMGGGSIVGEPEMKRYPNHWELTIRFEASGHFAIETRVARSAGFDLFITLVSPDASREAANQTLALLHSSFTAPAAKSEATPDSKTEPVPDAKAEADDEVTRAMRGVLYRVVLRRVYERHKWNSAALTHAISLLDTYSPPKIDFTGSATSLEIRKVIGDDPDTTWRMFLSVFYPNNRPPLYVLSSFSKPVPHVDAELKEARDTPITEPEWRTFTIVRPDGSVTLRSHTDVGTILTVADVSLEVEVTYDLLLQKFTDSTYFVKLFEDNALQQVGFDPKIDFELWSSSDAAMSVAEAIFGVYHTIAVRMQAGANVIGVSEVPPRFIDVWVYRDKTSFARTLATRKQNLISEHFGRSFALLTPRGAEIHVVAGDEVGPLRRLTWEAAESSTNPEELHDRMEQIFHTWVANNLELIGTISHELDHTILATREPNAPLWWLEGEATFYGEWLEAIQSMGMASHMDSQGHLVHDTSDQTLAKTCYESKEGSKCETMIREALESGKLTTPRAKEYALRLSRMPGPDLQSNLRRLILTPSDEFHQRDLERLNYALSWALAAVIIPATRNSDPQTSELRADLRALTTQPFSTTRDGVFSGLYDADIRYLAKGVHAYCERVR